MDTSSSMPRPVTIGICTSALRSNIEAFIAKVSSLTNVTVRYIELPYNDLDSFRVSSAGLDGVIICHSINNRRFAITDVMFALYDKFLPHVKQEFGKDNVCVIAHDFQWPMGRAGSLHEHHIRIKDTYMGSFRSKQYTTFECSKLAMICGRLDRQVDMDENDWTQFEIFARLANPTEQFSLYHGERAVWRLANPTEKFSLYHGERAIWWVEVTCVGRPGHGSQFIQDTAAVKLQKVLTAFLKYRDQEEARAKKSGVTVLGDVNTVNLVKLSGGVANNVVPSDLTVVFDLRVSPYTTPEDMVKKLDELVASGGPGVTYKLPRKEVSYTTPLGEDNTWWQTFKKACAKEKAELQVEIFPAGTDSKYIRALGIPCLGFSPMNNTPILLHDHNEYLNEDVFLRGISIYETIITDIASVPEA